MRVAPDDMTRSRYGVLLVAFAVVSVALCIWGALGWRQAYRTQVEADRLTRAEQLREAQLLRIVVSGGEAIAQMTLEGAAESGDLAAGAAANGCLPARAVSVADVFFDGAE